MSFQHNLFPPPSTWPNAFCPCTVPGPGSCGHAHGTQVGHQGVGRLWPSVHFHVANSAAEDDPQPDLDQFVSIPDCSQEAPHCWSQSRLRAGRPRTVLVSQIDKYYTWHGHGQVCDAQVILALVGNISTAGKSTRVNWNDDWSLLLCAGMIRSSWTDFCSTWATQSSRTFA